MKKLLLVALLISLSSTTILAKGSGKRGKLREIFKQLDLSEEQKESIKKMHKEMKESRPENRGEGRKLHEQMHNAFVTGASDSELNTIHEKIKVIKNSRMDRKFKKLKSIKSILNESQRKKFFELHKKMRKAKRNNH